MAEVKVGDTVRIHYIGKLEDGTVFDSTEGGASLELKLGDGEFLPGLEKGLIGMKTGENKTIFIPAAEAYGLHVPERVFSCEKDRLGDVNAEVGQQLTMYRADGMPVMVTVSGITDTTYTLDCNHPLAGKDLSFEITLEEIL